MKKNVIIVLFSLIALLFSGCYGALQYEEFDEPAVPDTIYIPPVKQKLAAVLGGLNYFVEITRSEVVWDEEKDYTFDETYDQYDDDLDGDSLEVLSLYETGLKDSNNKKISFSDRTYFSEVIKESIEYGDDYPTDSNDLEVVERRSFYEGKYVVNSNDGYEYDNVQVDFKYEQDSEDGQYYLFWEEAEDFVMTSSSTNPVTVSIKGEEVLPTDGGENISDGHSVIMSGEYTATYIYQDPEDSNDTGKQYSYTVKLEEFYFVYSYMQDFDETTNKFIEVEVITYGGKATIDGQKFEFEEILVVPKKGTDSGK
jgi:hypothetical protein